MMSESNRFPWYGTEELSSADLLRECGRKLTDRVLWQKFQQRFQRLIFMYIARTLRNASVDGSKELVNDLAQDVYIRLLQNEGRMLRSFKGASEFSVRAFLSR